MNNKENAINLDTFSNCIKMTTLLSFLQTIKKDDKTFLKRKTFFKQVNDFGIHVFVLFTK